MSDQQQSPFQIAMARFWRLRGAKFGAYAFVGFFLIGAYAPFIASETAMVWHDQNGWRFPLLIDLFNAWTYAKPHDLLFNLVALLMPPLLLMGWLLRRRWAYGRRLSIGVSIVVAAWILAQIPLPNHGRTGEWRALWDKRQLGQSTFSDWRAAEAVTPGRVSAWFPLIPHRHDATYAGAVLNAPGSINRDTGRRFVLGTDSAGHDVAARMLFGARVSLTIGLVATGLSLLIGVMIGAASGYLGGKIDLVLQRLVEIMMCFPTFILILTVVAMTSRDIFIIMLVIGLTGWADIARLVRGEFLGHAQADYVAAAQSLGVPRWRIMFRHILPNVLTPLIITATFGIAGAVFSESALSFIGLGDPNAATWGGLLEQGRQNIRYAWLIYVPGLAVFALITVLNLIGNGLREALDPKADF